MGRGDYHGNTTTSPARATPINPKLFGLMGVALINAKAVRRRALWRKARAKGLRDGKEAANAHGE